MTSPRATPSRRSFLDHTAAACAAIALGRPRSASSRQAAPGLPRIDLHVHLDNSSIDQVAPLMAPTGVRFGVVEHAGTEENVYPVVLSSDAELNAYVAMLDGHGVYKGVQTEWIDWYGCFSREALAKLDYVLTDTMTFPGKDGRRVKLWEPDAPGRVGIGDPEVFMDRYVDWHLQVMASGPFDVLANATWLPAPLAGDYDALWTERRAGKVLDAALKHGIAIEISSSYELPRPGFLRMAKAAGVRFSFGSNGRYPNMGKLDYSLAMAEELGLEPSDIFVPGSGPKAVERWKG